MTRCDGLSPALNVMSSVISIGPLTYFIECEPAVTFNFEMFVLPISLPSIYTSATGGMDEMKTVALSPPPPPPLYAGAEAGAGAGAAGSGAGAGSSYLDDGAAEVGDSSGAGSAGREYDGSDLYDEEPGSLGALDRDTNSDLFPPE